MKEVVAESRPFHRGVALCYPNCPHCNMEVEVVLTLQQFKSKVICVYYHETFLVVVKR